MNTWLSYKTCYALYHVIWHVIPPLSIKTQHLNTYCQLWSTLTLNQLNQSDPINNEDGILSFYRIIFSSAILSHPNKWWRCTSPGMTKTIYLFLTAIYLLVYFLNIFGKKGGFKLVESENYLYSSKVSIWNRQIVLVICNILTIIEQFRSIIQENRTI